MLKTNVGGIDRLLRIVIGIALIAAFFLTTGGAFHWLLLLGIIPLVTGLMRSCPLYSVLGLSSCPIRR